MPVLVTMRVKVNRFEGVKAAQDKYQDAQKAAGCRWGKIYRAEKDPNDILFLMEWDSHEAFNAFGDDVGEDFNALIQPVGDWDDVVWHLSDAAEVK